MKCRQYILIQANRRIHLPVCICAYWQFFLQCGSYILNWTDYLKLTGSKWLVVMFAVHSYHLTVWLNYCWRDVKHYKKGSFKQIVFYRSALGVWMARDWFQLKVMVAKKNFPFLGVWVVRVRKIPAHYGLQIRWAGCVSFYLKSGKKIKRKFRDCILRWLKYFWQWH